MKNTIKKNIKQRIPFGNHLSIIFRPSSQKGFTLIELLVVIVIIGILSTLGIVNYMDARMRARDAQRKTNLKEIQQALELYRIDQGAYPASLPTCGTPLRDPTNVKTYTTKVPCDPTNTSPFLYTYTLTGTSYTLVACLENVKDSNKDMPATNPACNGTSNWSFTVTNP